MSGKRLQFVVGKGGVGKSTVTAALAMRAAESGLRVLAVEFDESGGLSRLLADGKTPSTTPFETRPGLYLCRVRGEDSLAEYLGLVVPIRRLLTTVFASRLYKYFVAAAPGLKELMAVGKIWYEFNKVGADGKPEWDLIVVDAGASGHSLQYLKMPAAAATTFRSGLVHREAERVAGLLRDPDSTEVHVVSTPEDMPLAEAIEIVHALHVELGIPVGEILVNRCRPPRPPGVDEAIELLSSAEAVSALQASGIGGDARDLHGGLLAAAVIAADADRRQDSGIARLEDELKTEALRLPWIACDDFTADELRRLSGSLA